MLRFYIAILAGKITRILSRFLKLGSGSTWSGEIALWIEPQIIEKISQKVKEIILVTGTNGKTTTVKMIKTLLGESTFSNESGANLLNGIAGALVDSYSQIIRGAKKRAVFEVDEVVFPHLAKIVKPKAVVILNLFRDQLDRFGEVNTISKLWREALNKLDSSVFIILNADDPQVAFLGDCQKMKVHYFGLNTDFQEGQNNKVEIWGDSFLCPRCNARLSFTKVVFSHLGIWHCRNCGLKRAKTESDDLEVKMRLFGKHNKYNALASLLTVKIVNCLSEKSYQALLKMKPAFGRWEEFTLSKFDNKKAVLILSKNPTGMTQNLRTVNQKDDLGQLLIVLNDNIPDGRDISWIWDVNLPKFTKKITFFLSGGRYFEMALRLKYENIEEVQIKKEKNLRRAVQKAVSMIKDDKKLYILATYSAMLETRKILSGRKIL